MKHNEQQKSTDSSQKGGVRAYYYDLRNGDKKAVMVGQEPYHDLRYTYHNEAEASGAIASYQNKSLRGKATFSFEMGGNPLLMAEAKLIQTPPFRPYIPAEWRLKTVRHRFEPGSGYTTQGECELFCQTQQNTAEIVKNIPPSTDDTLDQDDA